MTARQHLMTLVSMLVWAGSPHAQECSGGSEGGTDATGHLCSSRSVPFVDPAPGIVLRTQGLAAYERGDYNAAVALFRSAAEQGDLRSAEMIVLMHRYSKLLYAGRITIDDAEAKKWRGVLAVTAQSTAAAKGR